MSTLTSRTQGRNGGPHLRSKSAILTAAANDQSSTHHAATKKNLSKTPNKESNNPAEIKTGFENYGQDEVDIELQKNIIRVAIEKGQTKRVYNPNSKYL
jgi:hypothetical protein